MDDLARRHLRSRLPRPGWRSSCGDVEEDPDYLSFPGSRTRSELAVPILLDGRPSGVINIESPRVSSFGQAELEAVEAWAGSIDEVIRSCYLPADLTGSGQWPSATIRSSS